PPRPAPAARAARADCSASTAATARPVRPTRTPVKAPRRRATPMGTRPRPDASAGPELRVNAGRLTSHHGYRWSALRHRWRVGDLVGADPRGGEDAGDVGGQPDRVLISDQHDHSDPRADR